MLFTGDRKADVAFSCLTGYLGADEKMSEFKRQVMCMLSGYHFALFFFVNETNKQMYNVVIQKTQYIYILIIRIREDIRIAKIREETDKHQ